MPHPGLSLLNIWKENCAPLFKTLMYTTPSFVATLSHTTNLADLASPEGHCFWPGHGLAVDIERCSLIRQEQLLCCIASILNNIATTTSGQDDSSEYDDNQHDELAQHGKISQRHTHIPGPVTQRGPVRPAPALISIGGMSLFQRHTPLSDPEIHPQKSP